MFASGCDTKQAGSPPGPAVAVRRRRRPWLPVLLILLLALSASIASAEQMVLQLFLNGEDKGEVFVHRTGEGDFLVHPQDLAAAGLQVSAKGSVTIEGESYLSLKSLSGVTFSLDERTLTLNLTAKPSLLPNKVIEYTSPPARKTVFTRDASLFLNYGAQVNSAPGVTFQNFSLANELGARYGDYLFLTDTLFNDDPHGEHFLRLHTSVTRDERPLLRRTVFGDFFANSGTLGGGVNMGGISVSKVLSMDPYFVTYPSFDFRGQAGLPSDVDVYVNGSKVRTEHVAPGEFQLQNFTSYGGAGLVELVVRDQFGREERYRYPYYAADALLLRPGLHDYSYNLGFLRQSFGSESNDYGSLAAVVSHRYGFRDYLTIGYRGEAGRGVADFGPQASVRLRSAGVLSAALSGSFGGRPGTGGEFSYQYLNPRFNTRLFYQYFSPSFRMLGASSAPQVRHTTGLSLGYTYPTVGSFSFDLQEQSLYQGSPQRSAALGYSKDFPGNLNFNLSLRRIFESETGSGYQLFAALNWAPRSDMSVTARVQEGEGSRNETLQLQKNPPLGEGVGYRVQVERDHGPGTTGESLNPMFQYNGRYGIVRAEGTGVARDGRWSDQYQLALSGALVKLDGVSAFTRPVTDSFAAVKVGEVEGVSVRYGAQEMGKTDASGLVILPTLSSYNDNSISFKDTDIPVTYYFPQSTRVISPPLRSGSCVHFVVVPAQSFTGTLSGIVDGKVQPLDAAEVVLPVGEGNVRFETTPSGEFFLDVTQLPEFKEVVRGREGDCSSGSGASHALLPPGTYRGTVRYQGVGLPVTLTIPASPDPIVDLGAITVGDFSPGLRERQGIR
ncbi:fimbrial protein [Geomonas sp. Red276]